MPSVLSAARLRLKEAPTTIFEVRSVFRVIIYRVRWGGDGDVLLIIILVRVRMVGSGNSILEDDVITSCLFEDITLLHCWQAQGEERGQ